MFKPSFSGVVLCAFAKLNPIFLLVAGIILKSDFLVSQFYYFYRLICNTKSKLMKVSTRNNFEGKVKKIEHGSVNSEVIIELPGGQEIVSIITKTSAENLGLAIGKKVYVLIKASNVMLGTED